MQWASSGSGPGFSPGSGPCSEAQILPPWILWLWIWGTVQRLVLRPGAGSGHSLSTSSPLPPNCRSSGFGSGPSSGPGLRPGSGPGSKALTLPHLPLLLDSLVLVQSPVLGLGHGSSSVPGVKV